MGNRRFVQVAAVLLRSRAASPPPAATTDDDTGDTTDDGGGGGRTELSHRLRRPADRRRRQPRHLHPRRRQGRRRAVQRGATPTSRSRWRSSTPRATRPRRRPVSTSTSPTSTILGLVGPAFSGETKAVLPHPRGGGPRDGERVGHQRRAARPSCPDGKSFHRVLPDDEAQAAGIVKYLDDEAEADDDRDRPRQQRVREGPGRRPARHPAARRDIEIVATEAIDPKSQDFSAAVNTVKAADPDAVFFGGYYEAGRPAEEAAGRRRRRPPRSSAVTARSTPASSRPPATPPTARSSAARATSPARPAPGKIGEFATAYEELNGTVPGTYSTEAFDAANILMTGIERGQHRPRRRSSSYVEGLKKVDYAISKEVVVRGQRQHRGAGHLHLQGEGRRRSSSRPRPTTCRSPDQTS